MSRLRRTPGVFAAWLVPLFLAAAVFPGSVRAETLRITGTGGAIGGMRLLAEAFRNVEPGVEVVIPKSIGSTGGIRAALAGKLDIGLSARPLNAEELAEGGRHVPYARTAFVSAVHPGVKRSDIALAEAIDIYAGRKTTWDDGNPLRLILRPAADTDTIALRKMSPEMAYAVEQAQKRERLIVATTDTGLGSGVLIDKDLVLTAAHVVQIADSIVVEVAGESLAAQVVSSQPSADLAVIRLERAPINGGPATGPFHWKGRLLSVEELCRLQTFPEGYKIEGNRRSAQRQIGNAVPSAIGEFLGLEIRRQFLGHRVRHHLRLIPSRREGCPPPERPAPVPERYETHGRTLRDHPGAGLGPGARPQAQDRAIR